MTRMGPKGIFTNPPNLGVVVRKKSRFIGPGEEAGMGRTAPRQAAKGAKNDDSSRLKVKETSASLDEWPSALWSVLGIVTCQKGKPGRPAKQKI
jgi:hypothetical protein